MSSNARIEALEDLVEQLQRKLVMLETDVARINRELEQQRGAIPPIVTRGKGPYQRRDPTVRLATLARTAAHARASKQVGEGKGAVRSQRTHKRLQKQRDEINRDEQVAIESGTRGRRKKGRYA